MEKKDILQTFFAFIKRLHLLIFVQECKPHKPKRRGAKDEDLQNMRIQSNRANDNT
jgi:hypothetical protein